MSGSIERKLTLFFVAATLLVLTMGYGFYAAVQGFYEKDRWVEHTHRVLDQINGTAAAVENVETNQRGFSLLGNPTLLTAYQANADRLPGLLDQLAALVRDSPGQQTRVRELRAAVDEELAASRQYVKDRQRLGLAALDPRNINNRGRVAMEAVHQAVACP